MTIWHNSAIKNILGAPVNPREFVLPFNIIEYIISRGESTARHSAKKQQLQTKAQCAASRVPACGHCAPASSSYDADVMTPNWLSTSRLKQNDRKTLLACGEELGKHRQQIKMNK